MRPSMLVAVFLTMVVVTSELVSLSQANSGVRLLPEFVDKRSGCKANSRLCSLRGSVGPNCCQNSCVDTGTDRQNCGRCGNKCKYMETCCVGQCVNVMRNQKHCGRCQNRCKKGVSCSYGMCNYA